MSVKDIFEAILKEDSYQVKKLFNEEVEGRILGLIEEKKTEVAKGMFGKKDADEEASDEDEDEEESDEEDVKEEEVPSSKVYSKFKAKK